MCFITYDKPPPYFCFFGLAKNTLGVVLGLVWQLAWLYVACYFVMVQEIIQTSILVLLISVSFYLSKNEHIRGIIFLWHVVEACIFFVRTCRYGKLANSGIDFIDEEICGDDDMLDFWPDCSYVLNSNFWMYYLGYFISMLAIRGLLIRCLYFYTKEAIYEKEKADGTLKDEFISDKKLE